MGFMNDSGWGSSVDFSAVQDKSVFDGVDAMVGKEAPKSFDPTNYATMFKDPTMQALGVNPNSVTSGAVDIGMGVALGNPAQAIQGGMKVAGNLLGDGGSSAQGQQLANQTAQQLMSGPSVRERSARAALV